MMTDAILVLNVGSSSIKASVFAATDDLPLLAQGGVSGIGGSPELRWDGAVPRQLPMDCSQERALREVVQWVNSSGGHWRLRAVGHRIVHGSERFVAPVVLTKQVCEELATLVPLAPLHQANNLSAVRVVAELDPDLLQIGCFDTAFHADHDLLFRYYALPKYLRECGIRRYGFHGLSYEWIARVLQTQYPEVSGGRVVAAHLGNGASLCAMRACKSVDTTMGMSTLDGLPMGTRCGSIDPGAILYMLRELGFDVDRIERILSRESGLAGLSGISHDVRELLASDRQEAGFALRFYALMTAQHVARMAVSLGGIDALVFTGGIGEHAVPVRQMILKQLSCLLPFEVLVIAANEARMIAEHSWKFVKGRVVT